MSKPRYSHSLRLKIVLGLLIPLLVTSLVTSYMRYVSYRRVLTGNLAAHAVRTAEVISDSLCRHAMLAEDFPSTRQILQSLVQQQEIQGLAMLDAEGRVVARAGDALDEEVGRAGETASRTTTNLLAETFAQGALVTNEHGDRVFRVVKTIRSGEPPQAQLPAEDEILGLLVSDFSMRLVEEQLAAYLRSRVLLSAGSMIVVLLVADFIMNRIVVTRLKHFLQAIEQIGSGDFSARVPQVHRDEISEVAEAFNHMSSGLAEKRRLELEITERTEQLRVQAERVSALNTLAGTVCQSLNLQEVLHCALDEVLRLLGLRAGWILLRDGQSEGLGPIVSRGLPEKVALAQVQCTWNRSVRNEVLELGQPRVFPYVVEYPCPADKHFQDPAGITALPQNLEYPCAAAQYLYRGGLTFRACMPLKAKDKVLGVMSLVGDGRDGMHELGSDTLEMLTAIGRQVGVAIENARLYEELREKEELRRQLLARVITVQEEERKRIARELHDQTSQSLTSMIMTLRILEESGFSEEVRAHVQELRNTVGQILKEVHELALQIRPSVLDDLGLLPALRHSLKRYRDRYHLLVDFQSLALDDRRLPSEIETALYRIVQEALTNVARHARATSVSVLLEHRDGYIRLIVEDDGKGFDVSQVIGSGPREKNLGLYGMRERAALLGGTVTIESIPGTGTTIFVTIPLQEEGGNDEQDSSARG
jgi:signal transduction histidine kinase